jgi:hypothetical protein
LKIKIYLKENNSFMGDLEVRKNSTNKTILKKIMEYIEKYYNCQITRYLPTGKIDYLTGISEISYVLFGNNLPFRNIYYEIERSL